MSSGDPRHVLEVTQEHAPSVRSDADETVSPGTTERNSTPTFGPPADPNEVGVIGPYRVVKELGHGGMGAVYAAVDTRLGRKLALKVMLPQFAADPASKERFLREARATAQITHDNVVTVYEADERDGVPYIAMQFLEGYPLDDFLKRKGSPTLPQILRIARETAAGLAAAHKIGLVHRDVKPGNLWLETPNGRVKVLDFGLARPVDAEVELTKSGAIVGTPAYMSPEQARGEKVDHRTDLFSLGVVMYRMCAGKLPFEAPTTMAVLMRLGTEDPTPVRTLNPKVPEPVAALIHQLLAKKPGDRPQSADDLLKRLRHLGDGTAATEASPNPKSNAAAMPVTSAPGDNPCAELTTVQSSPSKEPNTGKSSFPRLKRLKNPPPKSPKRWPRNAIAAGFLIPAIIAGIIIIIKHKDGTETKLEVADKSKVTKGEKNGKTIVEIEPGSGARISGPAALQFDGVDDSVRLPMSYEGTHPLTVEAWVSPSRLSGPAGGRRFGGLQAIVANTEREGLALGLDQSGQPYASYYTAESGKGFLNGYAMATAAKPVVLNDWVHLAAVYAQNECRLYVGGRRVATASASKPHIPSKLPFVLGADPKPPDSTSFHFQGSLAGVRLSKGERYKADFTPASRFERDPETLALYRFDEGTGDALMDSSGNNKHGTIVGAKWIPAKGLTTADPDRKAAEWVISFGGFVKTDPQERGASTAADLPKAPFKLTRVNLMSTKTADADLKNLAGLDRLNSLDLYGCKITDDGLDHLRSLGGLDALNLHNTKITNAGLAKLTPFKNLTWLKISQTQVTDAGLAALNAHPKLAFLELELLPLTDAGLQHLAALKSLKHLSLKGTKCTDSGVKKLAESLPACKISCDAGTIGPKP